MSNTSTTRRSAEIILDEYDLRVGQGKRNKSLDLESIHGLIKLYVKSYNSTDPSDSPPLPVYDFVTELVLAGTPGKEMSQRIVAFAKKQSLKNHSEFTFLPPVVRCNHMPRRWNDDPVVFGRPSLDPDCRIVSTNITDLGASQQNPNQRGSIHEKLLKAMQYGTGNQLM